MASSSMAKAKSWLSTVGSAAAAIMVARSAINDFLPYEFRDYLFSSVYSIFNRRFLSEITMIIEEFNGLKSNQIFEAVEAFIGARTKTISTSSTSTSATRFKVQKHESDNQILFNVDQNEEVIDDFEGIKFRWTLRCHMKSTMRSEVRSFYLTFHKKYKGVAMEKYLPNILKQAELLKMETKTLKIYTIDVDSLYDDPGNAWSPISLNHPATFDTVMMDTELKRMIAEDLDRFLKRKDYYGHVGKVWKREYLLYGPPGTGKSSLIAAMAKYLKFDVYDMALNGFRSDSNLRKALLGTTNNSILAIEDIDCSSHLSNREDDDDYEDEDEDDEDNDNDPTFGSGMYQQREKFTLSGLLNFIDGLWSSCGDERIIIFTTNHKEKLDPALLRPGRMDMHIHMSYCTPCGFKLLANNYLGVKYHELFTDIERLIGKVNVTPAEVAEHLMKHDNPDQALRGLVEFLELKKVDETNVAEAKKLEVESKTK